MTDQAEDRASQEVPGHHGATFNIIVTRTESAGDSAASAAAVLEVIADRLRHLHNASTEGFRFAHSIERTTDIVTPAASYVVHIAATTTENRQKGMFRGTVVRAIQAIMDDLRHIVTVAAVRGSDTDEGADE